VTELRHTYGYASLHPAQAWQWRSLRLRVHGWAYTMTSMVTRCGIGSRNAQHYYAFYSAACIACNAAYSQESCPSVCLSVKRVICEKNERKLCPHSYTTW